MFSVARVLAQQGEREHAQGGVVLRRMIVVHAAIVVAEDDIQRPMQAILDAPVTAGGKTKASASAVALEPM